MNSSRTNSSLILAGLLALPAFACASEPCPCKATHPSAAQAASPAGSDCRVAKPAPFAAKPVVVWNGDDGNNRASGWASCQIKEGCTATLVAKPGVGRNNSNGLEFVAKGPEWIGIGWNWFGWWPDTAGTDISKHKSVHFWLKVTAEPGKKKPEPGSVQISIHGSSKAGKDATESAPINDYAPGYLDGEWHEISVPLEPMLRGKGEGFNLVKAWEFDLGAWNPEEREYTMYLDEIGFL